MKRSALTISIVLNIVLALLLVWGFVTQLASNEINAQRQLAAQLGCEVGILENNLDRRDLYFKSVSMPHPLAFDFEVTLIDKDGQEKTLACTAVYDDPNKKPSITVTGP